MTIIGLNIVFAVLVYINIGIKLLDYIFLILLISALLSFENIIISIFGAVNAGYLGFKSKTEKRKII